ncbi:alcohol-forming fatty acyl-CoA reductase-like [Panicum miliaceum]|uniref:Fatty acyl-CoA reductase n=1 Tax=Panicum miliaceum TaxID=4540 RepID=A0A3L6T481_PANMI|nr:alcohol-forming fatty acyl-CoA reductase-like [Panicum miliaceum]
MDAAAKVAGCFRDRTILITGSTGFLGKLLVEKILRVQPGVKKLYLLVRAPDDAAAEQRVLHEIVGKELFSVLREKHGADDFQSFVKEKVSPLAGDMRRENLGLESTRAKQLSEEIDIIVNGAATTNFNERYIHIPITAKGDLAELHTHAACPSCRYDVALASNTLGTVHVCKFAKHCGHLKLLLHVSSISIAYVTGKQKGRILEEPFQMGQMLKNGRCFDIEAELELANEVKAKLVMARSNASTPHHQQLEKVAMKELGLKRAKYFGWANVYAFTKAMGEMLLGALREDLPVVIVRPGIITSTLQDPFPGWIEGIRTMDVVIAACYEQKLPCFIGGPILDSIPGDMVVNATMVAMATHYDCAGTHVVYHVTSALQNPLSCNILLESMYGYLLINPHVGDDKRTIKHKRLILFSRYGYFHAYTVLAYKTPLQVLYLANYLLHCGRITEHHSKHKRSLNHLMSLAKFYAPYVSFKGCFDDTNLRKLWGTTGAGHGDGYMFNFDTNCINWRLYLFNTHIPAVLKVAADMRKEGSA